MSLLSIKNLTLRFGGLVAVNDVTFEVQPGEIFSVIGPNGAGKTSLFNAITGIYQPTSGHILMHGHDLRKTFRVTTLLAILSVSLISFVFALLFEHAEDIWEGVITANYVYQEDFPWRKALGDLFKMISDYLSSGGRTSPLIAALIGALGAATVWQRSRRSPEVIGRAGISRTFQNIRLFENMTAFENVLIGMERTLKTNFFQAILRLPFFFRERKEAGEKALELLRFVELETYANSMASCLPYGYQRRLEIARALASKPELLLLDEPAAGMNPSESVELLELIKKIKQKGITVLLIEHHMRVVMQVSDRIAVLDYGNKIAEGTPEEVRANPKVVAAYLGASE